MPIGNAPAVPEVSYVVTQRNKAAFVPLLVEAFAQEAGDFSREYVFVDDGSTDDSVPILRSLAIRLPGPLRLIEQENAGASGATNTGVAAARASLIRLVDGDDLVTSASTVRLREAMRKEGVEFAYGDLGQYDLEEPFPQSEPSWGGPERLSREEGLSRFIRNCPANSSSILISKTLYTRAGGCNEELVSPDQMLFLRLFAAADGVHLPGPVARIPRSAPGRLSGQQRRSRYEAALALIALLDENPDLPRPLVAQTYRRAISRAYNYARLFGTGGELWWRVLWRYLASKLRIPADPSAAMRETLAVYTEDGRVERPESWKPGALRRGIARSRIG